MKRFFRKLTFGHNSLRTKRISKIILPFIKKGDKVLDLGAGNGRIGEFIKRKKKVDIALLDIADEHNESNLKIKVYDGGKVPFRNNSFDVVLLIYVLHHSGNLGLTLKEAIRVSKDKIIVFEDIANSKLERFITTIWDILVNLIWEVDWLPEFKSEKEWEKIFKKMDLKILKKEIFQRRPVRRVYYILKRKRLG